MKKTFFWKKFPLQSDSHVREIYYIYDNITINLLPIMKSKLTLEFLMLMVMGIV